MFSRSPQGLRRILLTTAGLGVAIATAFAPGTPSLAAGTLPTDSAEAIDYAPVPVGFSTWSDVFGEQNRLDAIATQIMASRNEPGFGGIYVSPLNRRVDLYWHGTVPSRVTAAIAGADRPVEVHSAPYTQADLIAQLQTLIAQPNVVQVAPRWNASGLDVTVDSAALRASDLQSLVAAPISVTLGAGVAPMTVTSKQNDTPSYWGAGRIYNTAHDGCSAGFAVMYHGSSRMITAAHCASGVGATFTDGGGDSFGTVSSSDKGRDYSLVTATAQGVMWTGVYNSTTFKSVNGAGYAFAGNFVCRSSSYSNAVCGLENTHVGVAVNFVPDDGSPPYTVFPVVHAVDSTHRLVASGNGDSGGSVYTQASPFVTARGIISNAPTFNNTIPCTGVPTSDTRTCHWETYYVDIASILEINNVQIMTS